MATRGDISTRFQGFLHAQLNGMYSDFILPARNSINTVIKNFRDSKLPHSVQEVTSDKIINFTTRGVFFVGGAYCLYKPLYNMGRQLGGCVGIISGFFLAYVGFRFIDKSVNRFIALSSCLYQGSDLFFRGETPLQTRLGGTLLVVTSLYMLNYPKATQETSIETYEFESWNLADKLSEQLNRLVSSVLGRGASPTQQPANSPDNPQ